jgi:hypothetical protein
MENIIHTFKGGNLFETTTELFKHLNISTQTFEEQAFLPQDFLKDLYKPQKHKAINEIYLVGIVTDEVFNGKSLAEVDNELSNDYQGLLIIAVDLKDKIANRTELSTLTRLFNRRFNAMPVAVLFRYGNYIALANAERTQYKQTYRKEEKIGKVSILKDIDTLKPHRGHLRILEKLQIDKSIKTFKELYAKWLGVFDTKILNEKFYKELFAWYEWAISETSGIKYPNDPKAIKEERQLEKQIIRLITRVLFVWFIKQKGLVPNNLFEEAELQKILKDFQANSSENGNYYNAILQNLFFATLNKEITERAFAKEKNGRDVKTLYRYAEMFSISEEKVIELFKPVPFLNGGLFECLDKDQGNDGKRYHLDGFSRNENTKEDGNRFRQRTLIPNIFFFEKDKGLFSILNKYYFTVEENTPEEVQVALDPELLGNVFENLLGAFNPETKESARKQSGSFYTPKEVVNYMVDESLKVYLKNHLPTFSAENIDTLFKEEELPIEWLSQPANCQKVIETIERVKILDPACGSGAFPMGILNRMVYILEKLGVDTNETAYQLKRHLIEKCIYGVDIQTIATQISKLRFFISLILEQSETNTDPALNYGIQPLPNLETKFVTANTLIDIREKKVEVQGDLFESSIITIKEELIKIREAHFEASSPYKKKVLREQDKILREKLIQKLKEFGEATPDNAKQFAEWDPYDQNASASFFDPEWMFGISDGFDIVIGNPPYGADIDKLVSTFKKMYPQTTKGFNEIYKLFFNRGIDILKEKGILTYITPNTYLLQPRYKDLRKFLLQYGLDIIINLGENVFDNAVVSTAIILLEKKKENSKIKIADLSANSKFLGSLDRIVFLEIVQTTFNETESNVFVMNIREKTENEYSLGEIMDLKDAGFKYQRKNVGLSEKGNNDLAERIFYEGNIKNKEDIPILIGKDINTYYHLEVPNKKLRKEYKNLLKDNESTYYNREIMNSKEKLIWRQTAPYFIGTILKDKIYFGNTIQAGIIKDSFINRVSYEYLCGLLNSKYLRYLYENNVRETGKVFPQVKLEKLRPLPIIISKNQSSIVNLVNEAIKIKKEDSKADITNIENQIDIYKLYGLSYEEIEVITPNIKEIISKEDYETE